MLHFSKLYEQAALARSVSVKASAGTGSGGVVLIAVAAFFKVPLCDFAHRSSAAHTSLGREASSEKDSLRPLFIVETATV